MEKLGIILDINVIMKYATRCSLRGSSTEFIEFLERRPNLGVITTRINSRVLKQLRRYADQNVHYRFYELKEQLKARKVDGLQYEKMWKEAKDFLHQLGTSKLYNHNPFTELGLEDAERLAEAACLKSEYEVLCLASLDRDFVDPEKSKAIEGKFKVKADYPINILNYVRHII
jgi:hypothetical protein